jgi:sec-independent protein translocase protein TatC
MDHVRELQGRLFAVAIVFVLVSAAAYPFFDKIVNFLVAPLGKDNELVYLTPGGAFSFIIQVCMYIGFVGALPAIIYNIYQFIMPAMKQQNGRRALIFTTISLLLAVAGMLFAYFVSLPAALYFLTSFNLYHINPMLTIDSYFSFIMTYMFAGALLFQIPLVMLMINGATPLTPKKLMRHQDKIILGSFIVAAIISPTPDALNQTLLASPIVVMYQVGIILVWLKNRKRAKARSQSGVLPQSRVVTHAPALAPTTPPRPVMATSPIAVAATHVPAQKRSGYSIDGFVAVPRRPIAIRPPAPRLSRPLPIVRDASVRTQPAFRPMPRRSIDGFVISS